MIVQISEKDVRSVLEPAEQGELNTSAEDTTLGIRSKVESIVLTAVPRFLGRMGRDMSPEGFELSTMSIQGKIVGSPCNVGIEAAFELVFERTSD